MMGWDRLSPVRGPITKRKRGPVPACSRRPILPLRVRFQSASGGEFLGWATVGWERFTWSEDRSQSASDGLSPLVRADRFFPFVYDSKAQAGASPWVARICQQTCRRAQRVEGRDGFQERNARPFDELRGGEVIRDTNGQCSMAKPAGNAREGAQTRLAGRPGRHARRGPSSPDALVRCHGSAPSLMSGGS
jgi:hypothetical protein